MAFTSFSAARDSFYCAALLLGIACGLFLRLYFTQRLHSSLFTFNIYLFSLAVFASAAVLALSRGAVFYDKELVLAALAVFLLALLSGISPSGIGFFFFALTGAAVIWTGAVFWRYPAVPIKENAFESAEGVDVRAGDLLPIIGGQLRRLPSEPPSGSMFREEFALLPPSKNRLVFSFSSEKRIIEPSESFIVSK